ncbi:hypothetical protein B0T26DRAFT_804373 [Lasiosphaeria miniovina]|uniref:FAR1 domain-containing protein n=1 Tax=Lasiosphaeria miniovina TaxID=1954250 RepID=A0AA40AD00_9PEZI|nr:uncharacterized protein B0T26DRAFT_804373 [Lasiosphaeria miniovina]KAK0713639.1 hypothetical protein B0T26DRAFT_804373 [Lasiosphaeria miniovina]
MAARDPPGAFDDPFTLSDPDEQVDRAPRPLPDHKLWSHKYDTIDQLMNDLQACAISVGFFIKKMRSNNHVKDFGATRVDISCLQNKTRPSEAFSQTNYPKECDCEFKAVATALVKDNQKWTFDLKESAHNHKLEKDPDKVFRPRRFWTDEEKAFVASYNDRPSVLNRDIAIDIRIKFPSIDFNRRQPRNLRYSLRKNDLASHPPF